MSNLQSILQTIKDGKSRDEGLAILADLISGNHTVLGAFIRVQITLDQDQIGLPPLDPEERMKWLEKADDALAQYDTDWLKHLLIADGFIDPAVNLTDREQWFLHSPIFTITAADVTKRNKGLAAMPAFIAAKITDLSEGQTFDGMTCLSDLHYLDLSDNQAGVANIVSLTTLGTFSQLRTLNLRSNNLGGEGGTNDFVSQRIVTAEIFPQLRQLDIAGNRLDSSWISLFARSTNLVNLRAFDCSDNNIGNTGFSALIHSNNFPCLRRLSVANNGIDNDGLATFSTSSIANNLVALDISHNHLDLSTPEALNFLTHYPKLEALSCAGCHINSKGLEYLLATLPNLKRLDISGNNLDLPGVMAALGREKEDGTKIGEQLTYLNLSDNNLSQGLSTQGGFLDHCPNLQTLRLARICYFAPRDDSFGPPTYNFDFLDALDSPYDTYNIDLFVSDLTLQTNASLYNIKRLLGGGDSSHLRLLDLSDNDLSFKPSEGDRNPIADLIHLPSLTQLRHLILDRCSIRDEEMESFEKSPSTTFTNLRHLSLRNNPFGDDGLFYLPQLANVDNLRTLDLGIRDESELSNTVIDFTYEGLKHLTFSDLINLGLDNRGIDNGISVLVDKGKLGNLQCLDLTGNDDISWEEFLIALRENPEALPALRWIEGVPDAYAQSLADALEVRAQNTKESVDFGNEEEVSHITKLLQNRNSSTRDFP